MTGRRDKIGQRMGIQGHTMDRKGHRGTEKDVQVAELVERYENMAEKALKASEGKEKKDKRETQGVS